MKKHNFNAGPSILADEVIENAAKAILDFNGSGLSLLSISHRTKDFDDVMAEADVLFRELLHIPDNYKIIYLGGGASTYFYEIPANFLGRKAGYVNTGVWAKKAIKEAKRYGEVEVLASSEDRNFTYIPKGFAIPADLDYVHITSNNTIYGTRYTKLPETGKVPLVADLSSSILSQEYDVTKFGIIFAGAQKNIGPAGVTIVIIRDDLLGHALDITPVMLNYQTMADKGSMYNTPPTYGIYMAGLTFDYLLSQGGVAEMEKRNIAKAKILYDYLDESKLFHNPVRHCDRSLMNVTFVTGDADKDAAFVKAATAAGFVNLKGHRSVGGMRASIYNAMPEEGIIQLVAFMKQFEADNK